MYVNQIYPGPLTETPCMHLFAEDRGRVSGEQEGAAGLRVRSAGHPGVQPPPAHLAGLPALPENCLRGLSRNQNNRTEIY